MVSCVRFISQSMNEKRGKNLWKGADWRLHVGILNLERLFQDYKRLSQREKEGGKKLCFRMHNAEWERMSSCIQTTFAGQTEYLILTLLISLAKQKYMRFKI